MSRSSEFDVASGQERTGESDTGINSFGISEGKVGGRGVSGKTREQILHKSECRSWFGGDGLAEEWPTSRRTFGPVVNHDPSTVETYLSFTPGLPGFRRFPRGRLDKRNRPFTIPAGYRAKPPENSTNLGRAYRTPAGRPQHRQNRNGQDAVRPSRGRLKHNRQRRISLT